MCKQSSKDKESEGKAVKKNLGAERQKQLYLLLLLYKQFKTPTLPCPPWGSTGLCIGGVWEDWTTPDWLIESERDWMAVSETVVQILGEPCLLSLLRSSTWNPDNSKRRVYSAGVYMWCLTVAYHASNHFYLTGPSRFVVGLQVFVIVVELGLLFLLLLLQGHQVRMLLLQLSLQPLWLTLLLQLLAFILLSKKRHTAVKSSLASGWTQNAVQAGHNWANPPIPQQVSIHYFSRPPLISSAEIIRFSGVLYHLQVFIVQRSITNLHQNNIDRFFGSTFYAVYYNREVKCESVDLLFYIVSCTLHESLRRLMATAYCLQDITEKLRDCLVRLLSP